MIIFILRFVNKFRQLQYMKTNILSLIAIFFIFFGNHAVAKSSFANESLNYVITYKWGVIHKDAGKATLTLRNSGDDYKISLYARTMPWADKIYMVRDTLSATIAKNGFKPKLYKKAAHENGNYSLDMIKYNYDGNSVTGKTTKTREKKGKTTHSQITLSSQGCTFDMLSIFYYLRTIDWNKLTRGTALHATIFSGSKAESLTIKPIGHEDITLRNKKKAKAYHIRFNFTTKGKKKSSADMDAWISDDNNRIPLMLIGTLPVGQVRCYLLN